MDESGRAQIIFRAVTLFLYDTVIVNTCHGCMWKVFTELYYTTSELYLHDKFINNNLSVLIPSTVTNIPD